MTTALIWHLPFLLCAIDLAITIAFSLPLSATTLWDFLVLAVLRAALVAINSTTSLLHVPRIQPSEKPDGKKKKETNRRPWLSRLPDGVWLGTYSFSLLRLLLLQEPAAKQFQLSVWSIVATSLLYGVWQLCWWRPVVAEEIKDKDSDEDNSVEKEEEEVSLGDDKMKHLMMLLAYARPHWPRILIGSAILMLSSSINLKYPFYHGQVMSSMMRRDDSSSTFIHASTMMLIVSTSGGLLGQLEELIFSFVSRRITVQLRLDLFTAAIRQEVAYFDSTPSATITRRLSSDCRRVSRLLNYDLIEALQRAFVLVGALYAMITLSWRLAVVPMAIMPLTKYAASLRNLEYADWWRDYYAAEEEINKVVSEAMGDIRTVRAFAAEKHERGRFERKVEEGFDLIQNKYRSWSKSAIRSVFSIADYLLYYALRFYAGYLVYSDALEPTTIITFLLLQDQFSRSFSHLVRFHSSVMDTLRESEKLFATLCRQPRVALGGNYRPTLCTPNGAVDERSAGHVRFANVSFTYPSRRDVPVLADFSFEARPGECVAIVGPSGAGKSTVVSLLERFYEPTGGEILIDDVPIADYEHGFYHQMLAIVPQEPVLHSTTIRENILYGYSGAARAATAEEDTSLEAEMIEAAKLADIHSFIAACPDGYSTQCGERGMQMSGGQKQKIAIARALVRKPRILLLDEATSAMDSETEHRVRESIEACLRNRDGSSRTLLVVAHRLSTVQNADRILVVKSGQIVQSGTHAELMSEEGLYREMVSRQELRA